MELGSNHILSGVRFRRVVVRNVYETLLSKNVSAIQNWKVIFCTVYMLLLIGFAWNKVIRVFSHLDSKRPQVLRKCWEYYYS